MLTRRAIATRFPLLISLFLLHLSLASQTGPVRVMTFNIRYDNPADGINSWDNRKNLVTGTLEAESPDIIGMQEVLERQAEYLKNNLKGFDYVGAGRDDGKNGGEYSPVFFKTDRFKVMDWGTFWLSPTPEDTGSVGWDAALTRICTWVKFSALKNNETFFLLNTHFDHMGLTARKESAKLILNFIEEKALDLPVILTGDFNCVPEDGSYMVLTDQQYGLKDACILANSQEGCMEGSFNGFGSAEESERIDLILLKGNWEVESSRMLKIKQGEVFVSDHWPVVAEVSSQQSAVSSMVSGIRNPESGIQIVQTFTFDSIVTRRAVFHFPEEGAARYEKILMYYTLKCDSLTPHDKYPCGEWDYTTYTRVYHHTGQMDSVRKTQASFTVRGGSPKSYLYSNRPTYSYFESCGEAWGQGDMGTGRKGEREIEKDESRKEDMYLRFEGADCIEVPGEAFKDIDKEITVAFWLNGDPFSQPMASTIFEGLDADGKRVINLHVPYDNGVVYWDAGGHGDGLTDNIYRAASPRDYKGRWTHWVVTKNAVTGEQSIYMNGVLFQQGKGLKRLMDGINTFRIGSNGAGTGKFYLGSLDDFAVWNVALDSARIISLFSLNPTDIEKENLLLYYNFDGAESAKEIADISGNGHHANTFGNPSVIPFGGMPFPDLKPLPGTVIKLDSIRNPVVSVILYGDSLHPGSPTDTMNVWPGWNFYFNSQGIKIDSTVTAETDTLFRKTRVFYGEPFEVVEQFEIARFITPYGKRLDLGLKGFTWIYDVTDYEPLLHGPVDLQAANGQELLDLKFLFIEGVPARDVISVRNIWPEGSYVYKDLADGFKLQATSLKLQEKAESFMLRARISGHGHYGPYNCCEWIPKKHYWYINGEKGYDWTVWRDCGMNPVHPQGGTWQFDRAGWCPGTFVDTYDFEMTSRVRPGEMVSIDYQIEPYDLDNGEEGGNYEMAMHLFEFSAPNFKSDLELNDILAPSDRQEYRRMNPISLNPVIRVKNTGSDTVRSFVVSYGMMDGKKSKFGWTGKLGFMQSADIILPKPSWKGLPENSSFIAEIEEVNGFPDERSSNNVCESAAISPVILPSEFMVHVKTQGFGRAADNSYRIVDEEGKVVHERQVFEDDSTYQDLVKLKPGAYDFTFYDKNEDGMIRHWWLYWEDKEKVGENGELKILDVSGNEIMDLGYDWAEKRTLQFFVGEPE